MLLLSDLIGGLMLNEFEYLVKRVEDLIYYAEQWLEWKSQFLAEWFKDNYLIILIIIISISVLSGIFRIARSYAIDSLIKKWREDENKKLELYRKAVDQPVLRKPKRKKERFRWDLPTEEAWKRWKGEEEEEEDDDDETVL
jgi:hypothetical protein